MLNPTELTMLSTLLNESHRRYHNINHIHQCLTELEQYVINNPTFTIEQYQWAEYALWYHDAIYNPYSKDNETNSMMLFERTIDDNYTGKNIISDAILNTARHLQTIDFSYQDGHISEVHKVVLDIDLSGFGKDRMVFALNGMNIRHEYYQTPLRDFLIGRQKFYNELIKRPTLYYTQYFYDKYHKISRENIEWEMNLIERSFKENDLTVWTDSMEHTQEQYYK